MPDIATVIDRLLAAAGFSMAAVLAYSAFLLQVGTIDPGLAKAISWIIIGAAGAMILIAIYLTLI